MYFLPNVSHIMVMITLMTVLITPHLISQIEEKVQMWQCSPASSLNVWFSSASCWSDLVLQALQFLAGETKGNLQLLLKLERSRLLTSCYSFIFLQCFYTCLSDGMMALPSGFSPFVEFVEESQLWRWIGKMKKS